MKFNKKMIAIAAAMFISSFNMKETTPNEVIGIESESDNKNDFDNISSSDKIINVIRMMYDDDNFRDNETFMKIYNYINECDNFNYIDAIECNLDEEIRKIVFEVIESKYSIKIKSFDIEECSKAGYDNYFWNDYKITYIDETGKKEMVMESGYESVTREEMHNSLEGVNVVAGAVYYPKVWTNYIIENKMDEEIRVFNSEAASIDEIATKMIFAYNVCNGYFVYTDKGYVYYVCDCSEAIYQKYNEKIKKRVKGR